MAGPIRAKKVNCSTCSMPYASLKSLANHMGKVHKNAENDELNLENSVIESAAAEADDEEQILANMQDDDFEDVDMEELYTKKEKEISKKVSQRKLKAAYQQKGLLRQSLKTTEEVLAKYKNDLVKLVKENAELKANIKTRDTTIHILEKKLNPHQCSKCNFKANEIKSLEEHTKRDHLKYTS